MRYCLTNEEIKKIIELENYEREIPDEVVAVIAQVKDKFDQLYIVFTDYTGKVERQIEKEKIPGLKVLWETAIGYSIYDFGKIGTLIKLHGEIILEFF